MGDQPSATLTALGAVRIDFVFYKLLTANDDSGRHGVLIPADAYAFFPPILGFDPETQENILVPITTIWRVADQAITRASNYVHYHRYPERRITSLMPEEVNIDEPLRLLILGRADDVTTFHAAVITPRKEGTFERITSELAIPAASLVPGGASGVIRRSELRVGGRELPFDRLLRDLQGLAAQGYVPSLRSGDTGVGYTLETMLGIRANVRMDADFQGIELKASRSPDPVHRRSPPSGTVTLFAKTPQWVPIGSERRLLDQHGYFDDRGRWSLYTSIYAHRPNPQGWRLEFDYPRTRLIAERHLQPVVYWQLGVLDLRLQEKHKETIFVTAHSIRREGAEFFRYDQIIHCTSPSLDNFVNLIDERRVFHDFALHRRPDGTPRDHGFLFRVGKQHLGRLFATVEERRL